MGSQSDCRSYKPEYTFLRDSQFPQHPLERLYDADEEGSVGRLRMEMIRDLLLMIVIVIWTFVERLILRWALSASQWQLDRANLCFRADPLWFSRMRLWMSDYIFTHGNFDYPPKGCILTTLFGC